MSLGKNIRILRIKRDLTAKALAERISVSPSLISKIERDATKPSVDVLRKIAIELHVSLGDLIDSELARTAPVERSHLDKKVSVVRAHERKSLCLHGSGLVYQILTPDLQGEIEFVWIEQEPGEGGARLFSHERGEECVLVLEGVLHIYIGDTRYALSKGDCITFDARLPHRYMNEGTERTVWVYIAVPPVL